MPLYASACRAAALLVLCAPLALAQPVPAPSAPPGSAMAPEPAASRDVRLGTLLSQTLIDAQSRELGRITDATLDVDNDRVTALVVEQNGARRAVPADAITPRDRGLEVVTRSAPDPRPAQPTPPRVASATGLTGMAIRDADGRDLGRIEDVVVSLDDLAVRYVVVRLDAGTAEPRLVPLPLRAFTRQETGDLRASVTRAQLEPAPAFTRGAWPRLSDPAYQARVRAWLATVPVREATSVKSNQG